MKRFIIFALLLLLVSVTAYLAADKTNQVRATNRAKAQAQREAAAQAVAAEEAERQRFVETIAVLRQECLRGAEAFDLHPPANQLKLERRPICGDLE